jgi:hypothetical protein
VTAAEVADPFPKRKTGYCISVPMGPTDRLGKPPEQNNLFRFELLARVISTG